MPQMKNPEVFISYASQNRDRVQDIVRHLESSGISSWRDQQEIMGGGNYGPEIAKGIKGSKVLMLMCSNESMRSKNVKQEIQLAWKYNVPYLPLLLEPVSFPEQVEYWLEGWQWIEILKRPYQEWLPHVLRAVQSLVVKEPATSPKADLTSLRRLARFTDQIWPLPAESSQRGLDRSGLRDLGAPQNNVEHVFRLGSQIRLAIEADHDCRLLLLDEGPSGKIYCLCPSQFAANTSISKGRNILPQIQSPYNSFVVSGTSGREHLLAVLTDEPLDLDWMPANPGQPARILSHSDIDELIKKLNGLDGNTWTALSTYFDVIA